MESNLLISFKHVAECGSFTKAAHLLNASQSTISSHINKLEDMLGKRLFVRTTRSCRLTTDGRTLLLYAEGVLNAVDRLQDAFRPNLLGGTIRVGVPDDAYLSPLLAIACKEFMEKRPATNIEIVAGLSRDLTDDLNDGHLDIALIREVISADNTDLLCKSKLVWAGSSDFALPKDGVLPLAHVNGPCSYFNVAKQALTAAEIPWKSTVSYTSLHGLMAMVKAGIAVCVVLKADCPENTLAPGYLNLPDLPEFGLKIHFASSEPPMLAKLTAKAISETLGRISA